MDLTWLAPQMKIRACNGPQRLMHFQGPILQMGPQRAEGSAACLRVTAGNWRGNFSQNYSWSSQQ